MKSFYSVVISVFLIVLTVFVCKNYVEINENKELENIISFQIEQDGNMETIHLWKNDEGKGFVFLPSYAELQNVRISLGKSGGTKIYIDGRELQDGDSLESVELEKEYSLSANDETYPVQFLKSANVATMYVEAKPEEIDRIYADKNNKTVAGITLYNSDGYCNYTGKNDEIKCRGNSTFGFEKKPFTMILNKPNDLLGMGSARKWVLLANAYDPTNLRNKLVLDFAKKTSLEWTPDCEYVDLYLNGEYNGLYLLCEKIEIGKNRLNINPDSSFLFTVAQQSKIYPGDVTIVTDKNRIIKIVHPKNCSKSNIDIFKDHMNFVESLMIDYSSEEDLIFEEIDIETWCTRYLIDEFFLNIDGDTDSSYYYYDNKIDKGKIFAGPVWDYDLCLGIGWSTKPLFNAMLRSNKLWYKELYENDVFYDKVKQLYQMDYKKILKRLADEDIDILLDLTQNTAKNNNLRWGIHDNEYKRRCNEIKKFIFDRMSFLDEYWFSGNYCDITISNETYSLKVFHTIKKGSIFVPSEEDIFVDGDITWLDASTGEEFDFSQPIFEDKMIYAKTAVQEDIVSDAVELNSAEQMYLNLVKYLEIGILAIFLLISAILAFVNVKNRQRGCGR